jgi:hypothetical protein
VCPFIKGPVEVSIILMPLNLFPVYCDRQAAYFQTDVDEQVIIRRLGVQRPVL